ncbi:MAG: putative AlkP superfamily pyrophosphatase or phosphodiesterase [Spirosomataceae bacterium]|jgi:predicted AlkP superfamily pyrophosphatase or phosphodiesterase
MKKSSFGVKKYIIILVVFAIGQITVFGQSSKKDTPKRKAVFIIVDGISADQLKKAQTPYLDTISQIGNYTDAYVGGGAGTYSETPTISAVGYNSLLTGTWANKHNVWGNAIKDPNYNYPSIFSLFKDQYPLGTTGIFSSWLDNRTKLAGEKLAETNNLNIDFTFDGLEHDSINFPHDKKRNFMKLIDYSVADHAAKTIKENAPDLSWVYLEFPDDMGHAFGDSPRFDAAIQFEDQLIGKIWEAITLREKQFNEEWLLIITTDHGRNAKNGKGHGGQTPRERSTWIVLNQKNTNEYFNAHTPGIVDIMPTIADFMHINIAEHVRREMDGTSLFNPVDAVNLKAKLNHENIELSWHNLASEGTGVKVFISETNNFKSGKPDDYKQVAEVSCDQEFISIPLKTPQSKFYKIVLETPNQSLNTWILN